MIRALTNVNIFDFTSYREKSYILFDKEIIEVGDMKNFKGCGWIYDCDGAILMPGLVNCHTHFYSAFARGMNIPFNPKKFMDILTQLWWNLDGRLSIEDVYYSGIVCAEESIKSGITTVIDHHASGAIRGSLHSLKKAVCDDAGIRGIFCFESSDRFNLEDCIEENLEFAKKHDDKSAGLFGMHASLSLSDKSMDKIGKSIGSLPVHIHVAESIEDEEDSFKKYNKKVVERLKYFGILNKNSILAHCVNIDVEEADIISKEDVYIAFNPTSNMNNSVGLPDYNEFKKRRIKCMLGTDGLGMNIVKEYLNMCYCMKHKYKDTCAFGFNDLIELILNGYEYVNNTLNIKIGKIEKGYKADFITVPYRATTPINNSNAFTHIFYGVFDCFKVRDVWCDGNMLLKDYKLTCDKDDYYIEAIKHAEKVWR